MSRRYLSPEEKFRRMPASALKILRYEQLWPSDGSDRLYGRRESSRHTVARLSERQNHRCCFCGKRMWVKLWRETGPKHDQATIEHIVPRSKGGTDLDDNLCASCWSCNYEKWSGNSIVFWYEKNSEHFRSLALVPIED